MPAHFTSLLANLEDLIELLIPVMFVIIYAIGGAMKKWLEKKEEQDRAKSLEKIHGAKADSPRPVERLSEPSMTPAQSPASRRAQTLPYARAYPPQPKPSVPPAMARQERIAEIQRKQAEFLKRISAQAPAAAVTAPIPPSPPKPSVSKTVLHPAGKAARGRPAKSKASPPAGGTRELFDILRDNDHLRTAFVLTEILGRPAALRENQNL